MRGGGGRPDYSSAPSDYSSASDTDWDDDEVNAALSPTFARSNVALPKEWAVFVDRVSPDMTKEDYMASLRMVFKFRTMLEFQDKFAQHKLFDMLSNPGVSIRVFQEQVSPIWEAPENRNGGKFTLSVVGRDQREVMQVWSTLLAVMCSGKLTSSTADGDSLVGAVIGVKDWGTAISMWHKDSSDARFIAKVRRKLRKLFNTHSVKYQVHSERPAKRLGSADGASIPSSSSQAFSSSSSSTNPNNSSSAAPITSSRSLALQSPLTAPSKGMVHPPIIDLRTLLIVFGAFFVLVLALVSLSPSRSL